jgi:RNA polymerase sigma-70 factor, ECF subfamily
MTVFPTPRDGDDGGLDPVLAAAQAGDEVAFAQLWRVLQPRLLRFLVGRGASGWAADAEAVAAETWLQVARDLPSFVGDFAAFRGWVYTIARHRLIDAKRMEARRPSFSLDDVAAAGLPALDDVEAAAETNAELAEVLRRIRTLPDGQRDVILLRVVAGLSVEETARVLGRKPGTVRVLAHRGLKALQAAMGVAGDGA